MTISENCRRCGRKIIILEGEVPACDECRELTREPFWLASQPAPLTDRRREEVMPNGP